MERRPAGSAALALSVRVPARRATLCIVDEASSVTKHRSLGIRAEVLYPWTELVKAHAAGASGGCCSSFPVLSVRSSGGRRSIAVCLGLAIVTSM